MVWRDFLSVLVLNRLQYDSFHNNMEIKSDSLPDSSDESFSTQRIRDLFMNIVSK